MTFRVRFVHGTKVYKDDNQEKVVWTLKSVETKLREARKTDPWLTKALGALKQFMVANENDSLLKAWSEDCYAVWMQAFETVLAEPVQQETPKPKGLFRRKTNA